MKVKMKVVIVFLVVFIPSDCAPNRYVYGGKQNRFRTHPTSSSGTHSQAAQKSYGRWPTINRGLAVVPHAGDYYGLFPLRGKMLNTREASFKQRTDNAEIQSLIKILGLKTQCKYTDDKDIGTLRYGKLMIMTDQDQDGSHIKGLIINFLHHQWPALLRKQFIEEFITPIIKATKGNDVVSFFSEPEFEEWKNQTPNYRTYKIKYYKGLGTSTAKEAREYFTDMRRHRIPFCYSGQEDDLCLEMAFKKDKVEDRKEWLTNWMEERNRRKELGLGEIYLYQKDTQSVSYKDFVNKELVVFSNGDNERSIPSLVDGFKPSQRKVMYLCFKRDLKKEIKVGQLANAVSEHTAYHHGEVSLQSTIVNLAQNYVGSNNLNLLVPIGQFGTRLQGGKDCAAARYIFTTLHPLTRLIFHRHDDAIMRYQVEDNMRIEPDWYCPIIPMVLVNGADGIGTGWSTKIPNYNPLDLLRNLRRMLNGEEPERMTPWYKNFHGEIRQTEAQKYAAIGEIARLEDDLTFEITELPVKTWTTVYRESLLDSYLNGTEKIPIILSDYTNNSTDTTVKFTVKLLDTKAADLRAEGLHKVFKLITNINTSCMVLFDAAGVLRTYNDEIEILRDFFKVRMAKYEERHVYLVGMLQAQADRLSEQARFILLKIDGKITLENKKKKAIVEQLIAHGFKRDPVKVWKEEQEKKLALAGENTAALEVDTEGEATEDEAPQDEASKSMSGWEYLVNQYLIKLSWEEKEKLERERDTKLQELKTLEKKTAKDLWFEDLEEFEIAYKENLIKDQSDAASNQSAKPVGATVSKTGGGKGRTKVAAGKLRADIAPTEWAERIEPNFEEIKTKAVAEAARKAAGPRRRVKKEPGDVEDAPLLKRALKERRKSGKKTPPALSIKRFLSGSDPKKKPPKVDLDGIDEDSDVELISTPKKSPARKAQKGSPARKKKGSSKKKREPWESDTEGTPDELSDESGDEEAPIPRERTVRQRKPINYNFDEGAESDRNSAGSGNQDGSDFEPPATPDSPQPPKKTQEVTTAKEDSASEVDLLDQDDSEHEPIPPPKPKAAPKAKPAAAKKPAPKRKASPKKTQKAPSDSEASDEDSPVRKKPAKGKRQAIDSDSDDDDFEPSSPVGRPAARGGGRAAAKGKKYVVDDSDENSF